MRDTKKGAMRTSVLLLWVLVISAELALLLVALHDNNGGKALAPTTQPPPTTRKDRFFSTVSVHPPVSSGEVIDSNGNPDTLYEEDKRIIHTGPNPLHN